MNPRLQPYRLVIVADSAGPARRGCAVPDALANVGGISVIERLIATSARVGFQDIAIVTARRAADIRRHVLDVSRRRGIALTVLADERMGTLGEGPFVLVRADCIVSASLLESVGREELHPDEIVVVTDGGVWVEPLDEGTARALHTGVEHGCLPVRTKDERRIATRRLVQATAKAVDGVAGRINRPLSDLATRVLVSRIPAVTSLHVTLLAFVVATLAALAYALALPLVAAVLILAVAVLDRTDGHVARVSERPSAFGSFLDPVLDRASDGLVIIGAGVYLASISGPAQTALAVVLAGAALLAHLLVSYTSSKAMIEVGHRYVGSFLGSGSGRDRRLLILSVGAAVAPIAPPAVAVSLVAVILLATAIVVSRLLWSWWAEGRGAATLGIRAVVLDFDGTIADSMDFLTDLAADLLTDSFGITEREATDGYLATSGGVFESQLQELFPGRGGATALVERFEGGKASWMPECRIFPDVVPALERLDSSGVPVFVCSSTGRPLVRDFCRRHGLQRWVAFVDGWRPGRDKAEQLASAVARSGFSADEVLFVGDSRRDADAARLIGARFVGLVREGRPDSFEGSGERVVGSLAELARDLARAASAPIAREVR